VADFAKAKEEVAKLADKLGNPIDPGILDTVAAFRALRINTIGSCEGHLDRATTGPYVMFEAPGTKALMAKLKTIPDKTSREYKKIFHEASKLNMLEVQKLLPFLDGFYEQRDTPHSRRLIVRCFGPTAARLMAQNADLAEILSPEERVRLLDENQSEMWVFTDYLKKLL
jgi:hypothetical protein